MPYRQTLYFLSTRHKLVQDRTQLPRKLSLKVLLNREAQVDAQLKTLAGRPLLTLHRLVTKDSKTQEIELQGELSDAEGHPFVSGTYLLEIKATAQDGQTVTRRLPVTIVR